MAEKRMFTKKITDDDNFISLPSSTQALYFHLNQGADDDGFNNQVQMAMFKAHATVDDLKVLMAKNYIIRFDNGVIVIKHWRMHNTLRKDRYQPTNFQEELKMLNVKTNGAYTLGCQMVADWLPDGCHSIDKISVDKDSLDKGNIDDANTSNIPPEDPKPQKPSKHKYGEYNNVLLTDDELDKLKTEYSDWEERIERLSSYVASTGKSYKSHYATIRNWARKDQEKSQQQPTNQKNYQKQTKAEELDEFYKMAADWGNQ